jgi:hypothetical protein
MKRWSVGQVGVVVVHNGPEDRIVEPEMPVPRAAAPDPPQAPGAGVISIAGSITVTGCRG